MRPHAETSVSGNFCICTTASLEVSETTLKSQRALLQRSAAELLISVAKSVSAIVLKAGPRYACKMLHGGATGEHRRQRADERRG